MQFVGLWATRLKVDSFIFGLIQKKDRTGRYAVGNVQKIGTAEDMFGRRGVRDA
jgi:hypothetical protein